MWPTPRATDGTHGGRVTSRKGPEGGNLVEAVSARTKWPTPTARDWKGSGYDGQLPNAVQMWPTPTVEGNHNRAGSSPKAGNGLATVAGGALNPAWVEALMGFPPGWTDTRGGDQIPTLF